MSDSIADDQHCIEVLPTDMTLRTVRASPRRTSTGQFGSAIWSYVLDLVARRAMRRLEMDLERLDDRMLKDIGLDRSEIRRVVHYGREF